MQSELARRRPTSYSGPSSSDITQNQLRYDASSLKVCNWTKILNHYQRAFSEALCRRCDLRTVYFESLPQHRLALGWSESLPLCSHEIRCDSLLGALEQIPDWRERIHIVPGYGGPFQRSLAKHLTDHCIPWADWSESSTPGWKWYARLPVKLWWTLLLKRASIGSFAIGSQAEDDFVRRGISRSKISYLPYVSALFDPAVEPDPDMTLFKAGRSAFLFLGSLSTRKGVDVLLRSAAPVLRAQPNWTLILVGNDTPKNKFRKLAERLNLSSQVLFRGPVPPNLIGSVLAAANVLVLPSRYDGWGVAINEAVNGGLAVIGSHECGASRHLIIPGQNGFRIQAGSASDLETALRRYAQSSDLSERHGEASKLIARDVDPDLNARRMLASLAFWVRDWNKRSDRQR